MIVRWNPARDALVKRDYPADVDRGLIAEACNRLPGRPMTADHVTMRAQALHLRRSPAYLRHLSKERVEMMANARHFRSRVASVDLDLTGVPASPQILAASPGTALPPVPAAWETIRGTAMRDESLWLGHQGDLIGYNRKRIARGLAPFVVERR